MTSEDGWMRYLITDGQDQRQRVARIQAAAANSGCSSRTERGAGLASVDVWVPCGKDVSSVELAIFETTGEDAKFEVPGCEGWKGGSADA